MSFYRVQLFQQTKLYFYNYTDSATTLCRLAAMCQSRYLVTLQKLFLVMLNEQKMNIKYQGDIKNVHSSY